MSKANKINFSEVETEYNNPTAITSGASIEMDLSLNDMFSLAIGHNVTLDITNVRKGSFLLRVDHHASNTYTIGFTQSGSTMKYAGGTTPPYSMASGGTKVTLFTIVFDGTNTYISDTNFF